ncbi:MAG: GNAT family N-acetyltransferase [Ilumatobacter sp.]|nr:GNAT family N-acetyltransferase [Ilumatobacter sp.]MDG1391160.1 GNAT family N-acetyltransferase [Ilumatobacter sp.]MDG2232367.1 GNAT family N-acetyltransferase [Ilumatobacter sp.]
MSESSQSPSVPTPSAVPAVPQSGASVAVAAVVDDELVAAFAHLIPQLSQSSPPPDADQLRVLVDGADTVLFVARVDGVIVGSLTLAFYRIPTGLKAWIEDVVVDDAARGHGVGRLLNEAALAEAESRGAKDVSLTSRPSREAANRLYQRIGFEARDTNVYRYKF